MCRENSKMTTTTATEFVLVRSLVVSLWVKRLTTVSRVTSSSILSNGTGATESVGPLKFGTREIKEKRQQRELGLDSRK